MKNSKIYQIIQEFLATSVVDPDPNWNCIQPLCGSGSVFQIRIRIHSLKNRKKRLHYQKNINPNFDINSDKNIFLIFLNIDELIIYTCVRLGSGSKCNVFGSTTLDATCLLRCLKRLSRQVTRASW